MGLAGALDDEDEDEGVNIGSGENAEGAGGEEPTMSASMKEQMRKSQEALLKKKDAKRKAMVDKAKEALQGKKKSQWGGSSPKSGGSGGAEEKLSRKTKVARKHRDAALDDAVGEGGGVSAQQARRNRATMAMAKNLPAPRATSAASSGAASSGAASSGGGAASAVDGKSSDGKSVLSSPGSGNSPRATTVNNKDGPPRPSSAPAEKEKGLARRMTALKLAVNNSSSTGGPLSSPASPGSPSSARDPLGSAARKTQKR